MTEPGRETIERRLEDAGFEPRLARVSGEYERWVWSAIDGDGRVVLVRNDGGLWRLEDRWLAPWMSPGEAVRLFTALAAVFAPEEVEG